jgi:hypothetical protein
MNLSYPQINLERARKERYKYNIGLKYIKINPFYPV